MKNAVLQQIGMFLLLIFLAWSYGIADYSTDFAPTYGTEYWRDSIYWIGESFLFTFFCLILSHKNKWEDLKWGWGTMAVFLMLRTIVLVMIAIYGINPNQKRIVVVLFCFTAAVIIWTMFLPIIRQWILKLYPIIFWVSAIILKAWRKLR